MSDEQDADAIALLLDANGLSSSAAAASTIDTIELFMASYPTMRGLHAFPALTTLELIACGITAIAGLGRLTSLKRLALCENRIARLEGLDANVNLVSLDLRANAITRVGNVSHLVSLEYLSLADNRVASLAGLKACQSLTTLNVANNAIGQCGSELEGLRALRDLNLSGNRIGCLDDVRFLGRALPSLRNVYLSDPHYGDNPVCALCNYQTFALYHLAQVDILDGTLISAQARANAQSVYVKKVMYYNMRIKIAKKQATDAIRQAGQVRLGYLAHINVAMSVVWRQKRDLDQVRHQRALAANRPTRAADPNDLPVSDAALREK